MSRQIFLIDTNSFIEPYRKYYAFDLAPGFWSQMGKHIKEGSIAVLDMVRDEILNNEDDLTKWLRSQDISISIDHREGKIVENYGQILQYIQSSPYYQSSALNEWARKPVADPWLIAAAIAYQYPIVTFETHNTNLNQKFPSKMAQIPDVADHFGVTTLNLFSMMRLLRFRLTSAPSAGEGAFPRDK